MRTGNNDHADWNNEPPKDDFPYDKPDVHSYRIGVWQVIFWAAVALLGAALAAVGIVTWKLLHP